jgi:nucleoside-diphosphate-sugar epimerase
VTAGCRTYLAFGSQAEYGPANRRLDEAAETRPTTLYGAAKLAACHISRVTAAAAGMRFVWLRLFSAYGPDDNPGWMLPSLILQLAAGRRPALTGCEQRWDYIHVNDVSRAVLAAISTTTADGVFNLGSGCAVRLREVVEMVRDRIDPRLKLGIGDLPYRPDQVMYLEADIGRLSSLTGWQPTVEINQGIAGMVDWFTTHLGTTHE